MTRRTARTAPRRPYRPQAWLALLLLVGLLGMHGLASNHATAGMADHTAMGDRTSSVRTAADPARGGPGPAPAAEVGHMTAVQEDLPALTGHPGQVRPPAATQTSPTTAAPVLAAPDVPDSGTEMTDLCLAVLTAALLLLRTVTAHVAVVPRAACRTHGLLPRIGALPPPRPPDLVAGLCVSRT